MKKTIVLILILLIPAMALPLFSCGKQFDMDEDPSLSEIIDIGKGYLKANRGAQAAEAFQAARDKCEESTDASFGLILGNVMAFVNLADELVSLAGSLFQTAPDSPAQQDGVIQAAQGMGIGDYIQQFIADTIELDFDKNDGLFREMAEGSDFIFTISNYPIIFGDEAVVSFGGEFDKTDLYFFGGLTSLMNAVIDILQAHNINFDFNNLALPEFEEDADILDQIAGYMDFLEGLLSDPNYPDFLHIKDADGLERMKSAGVNLGNAFDRLGAMFSQLKRETDYQFDDQVRYLDLRKNNRFDMGEDPVIIDGPITIDARLVPIVQNLFFDLSLAFWEGSPSDPHPHVKDTLNLGMLNDLLVYLKLLPKPILPEWIGINIGSFFSNPTNDGIYSLLMSVIEFADLLLGFLIPAA